MFRGLSLTFVVVHAASHPIFSSTSAGMKLEVLHLLEVLVVLSLGTCPGQF